MDNNFEKIKDFNVLSLFDGMSCGQIALNKGGIKYTNYFASEINEHSIKVAQHNYPNTKQLGNVKDVIGADLPKIDLLIGGSPCKDLTRAKNDKKNLEGSSSKLFWEYARLIKEVKPKYFLLENVEMNKASEIIITKELGVNPIKINSVNFSAQNRPRVYWTNIPLGQLPIKKQLLSDILEDDVSDKYFLTEKQKSKLNLNFKWGKANSGIIRHCAGNRQQDRIYRYDGVMACINGGSKGSSPHLTKTYLKDGRLRFLTPVEYERLQTVPDNYTECVADMYRYEMLGNGWTVDVIAFIFSFLKGEEKSFNKKDYEPQTSLWNTANGI